MGLEELAAVFGQKIDQLAVESLHCIDVQLATLFVLTQYARRPAPFVGLWVSGVQVLSFQTDTGLKVATRHSVVPLVAETQEEFDRLHMILGEKDPRGSVALLRQEGEWTFDPAARLTA